jgi:hypothetical protein
MADQHGGMAGGDEAKAQLVAPKQVEKILDQTYESDPGTALGRYTITRMLKPVATGERGYQIHRRHRHPGTHPVARGRFFASTVPRRHAHELKFAVAN